MPPYNVDAFGSVNPLKELHDVDVVEQGKETWRWVSSSSSSSSSSGIKKRRGGEVITDLCANRPVIIEISRSHALVLLNFVLFVRLDRHLLPRCLMNGQLHLPERARAQLHAHVVQQQRLGLAVIWGEMRETCEHMCANGMSEVTRGHATCVENPLRTAAGQVQHGASLGAWSSTLHGSL
jgi:hypothetical protein